MYHSSSVLIATLLFCFLGAPLAQEYNASLLLPNPFGDTMRTLQDATAMAALSTRAYTILTANSEVPAPYALEFFWDSGSTDMVVVTDESRIYVVFRGTDESADGDWITNLDIIQDVYGPPEGPIIEEKIYDQDLEEFDIRVHSGFNSALFSQNMYGNVTSVLTDLLSQKASDTIYVTGHSLGGANAQLFGTLYAYFNPDIFVYITTFGSPRVGNYGFSVLANSLQNLNVWRFVNRRDLVPRGPTTNYEHAGHIMWKEPCDKDADPNCDGPVVAHYRQTGDKTQGYDGIGSSGFTLCKYNLLQCLCLNGIYCDSQRAVPYM